METSRRVAVRVRPGASRVRVGGSYAGRHGAALVVAVTDPPVDGRATAAVAAALARAFEVPKRQVTLVAGARGRDKIFEVTAPDVDARLARLLAEGADEA